MSIVKRFPYGIYFFVTDDIINIFAVFHFSRNPKVLKKKVKANHQKEIRFINKNFGFSIFFLNPTQVKSPYFGTFYIGHLKVIF